MSDLDHQLEVQRTLGRMEGKLDALVTTMATHVEDDKTVEKRVGKLERRQAWTSGASAVIGTLIGWTVTLLGSKS